ncbi:MAG: FkbM family methyltransferase [Patescibacteria group bacterium]|nr:FkbM family methyltransferase [Patescibacteria group bacterium]MCL5431593.1 FkbM family methyltransferase [Patescibacteria group bacterium]
MANLAKRLILLLAQLFNINLTLLAYRANGILNSGSLSKTGEQFVIDEVLPKLIAAKIPIFFDVGGDTGETSEELIKKFPNSRLFSFEPNPIGFIAMRNKLKAYPHVICENLALGNKSGRVKLYRYQKYKTGLITGSKVALSEFYRTRGKIVEFSRSMKTIDQYCGLRQIRTIDFLKIDVEGNELNVLKGAKKMIKQNKIKTIQFEFNNFNVINRTFLYDFYKLLPNFDLYRIRRGGLVYLDHYDSINEIFKFQNILAVIKHGNDKTI